jgi:hypothetical protein
MLWGALPEERQVCDLLVQFSVIVGTKSAELITTSYCLISDYWVPSLLPLTTPRAKVVVF